VILVSVGVLAAVQVLRLLLTPEADWSLVREFAFVPARIWLVLDPHALAAQLAMPPHDDAALQRAELAEFFVAHGGLKPWTLLTYALLHGGFAHLGMNALWLVAFGAPVARRFGPWRFLALLAVASAAGAIAQTVAVPFGVVPIIGASAAVSGAVGAAIRFVFQPGENLGPIRAPDAEPGAPLPRSPAPPLPLVATFGNRQVVTFLVVWFVVNFLFGILAEPLHVTDQAIAWEAHIGGFLAGLLLFQLFDRRLASDG
jgi:membrane associated rhomboid family serine protease